MAGSINDFKSSFKTDVARPNRFDVAVPVPIVLKPYLGTARNLGFRCEAGELPGRAFATAEQRFGSNPVEKYPYQTSYSDMTLTFIVSDNMSEKVFFDAWMEYIQPASSFNLRYKSDYTSSLKVNQYDVAGNLSYAVNLVDAFPVSMNQMDLDWSADGFHKLSIVFAYTRWVNNSIQALGSSLFQQGLATFVSGQNPLVSGPISNLIDKIPGGSALAGIVTGQTPVISTLAKLTQNYVAGNYFAQDYVAGK